MTSDTERKCSEQPGRLQGHIVKRTVFTMLDVAQQSVILCRVLVMPQTLLSCPCRAVSGGLACLQHSGTWAVIVPVLQSCTHAHLCPDQTVWSAASSEHLAEAGRQTLLCLVLMPLVFVLTIIAITVRLVRLPVLALPVSVPITLTASVVVLLFPVPAFTNSTGFR